jgi:deaminated glutathione amidase
MKVAVLQMVSSPEVSENLSCAQQLIEKAAAQNAELVVLPEYFCGMGLQDTDKLAWAEGFGQGPLQDTLAHWAKSYGVWLVGGTIPIQTSDPYRVHNTCMLFSPDGQRVAHYDKIHLFRFANETERYDESVVIAPGRQPVVAQVVDRSGQTWKLGLSVCYDLRFPELYRALVDQGVQVLLCPAAFTHTTGQAHWELLLRARAVESQCWMLASAQGGQHANGRTTWGHSMVVDPWGQVLSEQHASGSGISYATLDPDFLQQVRQRLPALEHRCL